MRLRRILPGLVALLTLLFVYGTASAQEPDVVTQLRGIALRAAEGMAAAETGDLVKMREEYHEIHDAWELFEDDIKVQNPAAYVEMEAALDGVKELVQAASVDAPQVAAAYAHLQDEAEEIAEHIAGGGASTSLVTDATPTTVLQHVRASLAAAEAGRHPEALEALSQAVALWPAVEGAIAAKSADDYSAIETSLGTALAALKATPVDGAAAESSLEELSTTLQAYSGRATYGVFDATAIIFREGLEALLVVAALIAFLRKSGNADKSKWIWLGAAAGVAVSIGAAFLLQIAFNRLAAGQNREVIEGITSLVAAALLFYVAYWLHGKSHVHTWQRYINERTSHALARGSLLGLAFLAFLAVFREGAETTVFYLGMAPSIALRDLLMGMGLGIGLLVIIGVLVLVAGIRLPFRLFFTVASLLVFYLGFKFIGVGIHALQVAGVLPASPVAFINSLPLFGVYPTWESLLPQIVLLALAAALVVYMRIQNDRLAAQNIA